MPINNAVDDVEWPPTRFARAQLPSQDHRFLLEGVEAAGLARRHSPILLLCVVCSRRSPSLSEFGRIAREQARLLVARGENDVKASFATLADFLGYRAETSFHLDPGPMLAQSPGNSSALVDTALSKRPDLVQLRCEEKAASQFAQAEKAGAYPTLSAIGSAGVIPLGDHKTFERNYAAIGLNLNFPLFSGGEISARRREAELKATAAEERLREAEDEAIREVRVARLNVEYALERIALSEQLLQSSEQAFKLAEARYQLGSSSITELSQAQLSLVQAQIEQTSAKYEYQIQRSVLDYQTGAGH